jgi:hypothetical protein
VCHVIAAYILLQTDVGKAAIEEVAKLVTSRIQAPGGVTQAMSCPVVLL